MHIDRSSHALRRLVSDIGELHIEDVEAIYQALDPAERQQARSLFGEILGERLGASLGTSGVTTVGPLGFDEAVLRRALTPHPRWLQLRALAHLDQRRPGAIGVGIEMTSHEAQRDNAFSTTPATSQALRELILAHAPLDAPQETRRVEPPRPAWLPLLKRIWSR